MSYETEGKALIEEVMRRKESIIEKYKEYPLPAHQLDGGPDETELREVSKWFSEELKKLKDKYNIKNDLINI